MLNREQCAIAINVAMKLEQVGYDGAEFADMFGEFANNDPQITAEILELYRETSDCTRRLYLEIMYRLPSVERYFVSYKL